MNENKFSPFVKVSARGSYNSGLAIATQDCISFSAQLVSILGI